MNEKNYFIFNDINSKDLGLHIEELPIVPTSEEGIDVIEVEGRDGFLLKHNNHLKYRTYDVDLILKDIKKIDLIKQHLRGSGKLILSNNLTRYYNVTIINKIDFERIFKNYNSCLISFIVQPFEYEIENTTINVVAPTIFKNNTNATCKPILKIYGTSSGTVRIGNDVIQIKNIKNYVELDYDLQECYRYDDLILKNCNGDVLANFKEIPIGDTEISFTGGITRIEINPRFRWL